MSNETTDNFRSKFASLSEPDALEKRELFAISLRKMKKQKIIETRRRKTYQALGLPFGKT